MNESSDQQSFCYECHKECIINYNKQLNKHLGTNIYNDKAKNLKDAETRFHKLQREIMMLKEQNQKKIQTIQQFNKQFKQTKRRKSSVEMQIEDNQKSFQQLKHSLISFGNSDFPAKQKLSKQPENRKSGSVSADLIINSFQKRLKQYKIELLKLIEKVELHERSTQWMYQFIDSFLKMVVEINKTRNYAEPLVLKELSIKKRTKIAWKYLKKIFEKILNQQR